MATAIALCCAQSLQVLLEHIQLHAMVCCHFHLHSSYGNAVTCNACFAGDGSLLGAVQVQDLFEIENHLCELSPEEKVQKLGMMRQMHTIMSFSVRSLPATLASLQECTEE